MPSLFKASLTLTHLTLKGTQVRQENGSLLLLRPYLSLALRRISAKSSY